MAGRPACAVLTVNAIAHFHQSHSFHNVSCGLSTWFALEYMGMDLLESFQARITHKKKKRFWKRHIIQKLITNQLQSIFCMHNFIVLWIKMHRNIQDLNKSPFDGRLFEMEYCSFRSGIRFSWLLSTVEVNCIAKSWFGWF